MLKFSSLDFGAVLPASFSVSLTAEMPASVSAMASSIFPKLLPTIDSRFFKSRKGATASRVCFSIAVYAGLSLSTVVSRRAVRYRKYHKQSQHFELENLHRTGSFSAIAPQICFSICHVQTDVEKMDPSARILILQQPFRETETSVACYVC